MQHLTAEGRFAEILRQALAEDRLQQPFDPEKRDDSVSDSDQKDGPEGRPGDERADGGQILRIGIEGPLPRPRNVDDDGDGSDEVEGYLDQRQNNTAAKRLFRRREAGNTGCAPSA